MRGKLESGARITLGALTVIDVHGQYFSLLWSFVALLLPACMGMRRGRLLLTVMMGSGTFVTLDAFIVIDVHGQYFSLL